MTIHNELILELLRIILYVAGLVAFVAFNAAYLSLLERKIPGWFQLRHGPKEVPEQHRILTTRFGRV